MSGEHKTSRPFGGRDGQYPAEQAPGVDSPGTPSGGSIPQYPDAQIPGVEFSGPISGGDPMDNPGSLTKPAEPINPRNAPDEPGIARSAGGI
ncbi:MAG: hypothetical protein QNL12_03095 [Acidimicrobiia bacterium]|nr:hypothetical protein [Acidimicrobiia bacterium]